MLWCEYTGCVCDVCTYGGGPTALLRVDECVQGSARPPCLVVKSHTAEGLSPSPPPAPASSTASHSLSAAQTDKKESLYSSIHFLYPLILFRAMGGVPYSDEKHLNKKAV